MRDRKDLTRRNFLLTGAVLGGAVLVGAPVGRSGRWLARAQPSMPPVVDSLTVTVVTDAYHDLLAPNLKLPDVDVQRVRRIFHGQHGLSLHLKSQRGRETRNFLLDFGFTPEALITNLNLLKIDTALLDALILSHGHKDHFGSLVPFLKRDRAKMRKDLPMYVGGEDVFCHRWLGRPGGKRRSFGVVDRRDLAAANVRVVMAEKPAAIEGQAFTTGTIARESFEKVLHNTIVEVGVRDSAGCSDSQFRSHFTKEELEGKFLFDNHWGEHATCFNIKDRGLVVMTSCGHAGLINTIRQAQAISGVQKVHAVMGGFHLAPAKEAYVAQEVQALKKIDPDYIIPMHCSGATFTHIVAREMPDKLIMSYVGTRYIFGA